MNDIVTLPNILSLLRAPLALCLFYDSPMLRCSVVFVAMMTDFFDGFLARKLGQLSKAGAILDPLMDKLFVFIALLIFYIEQQISSMQVLAFLSRDISLIIFSMYHLINGSFKNLIVKSIWVGKIATTCQFFVLLFLTLGYAAPEALFSIMAVCGVCALPELVWAQSSMSKRSLSS